MEVFSDTVDYTEEYESESTERMILTQIDPMHLENTQEESQEEGIVKDHIIDKTVTSEITERKRKPETTDGQILPINRLTKAQRQCKHMMTQESKVNDDPFIGKPVAFSTNSDVVKELKKECGKRWSGEAICYHLDNKFGHVVGVVMRKSRGIGSRRGTNGESTYDVAWEFSALGETLVTFGFLL